MSQDSPATASGGVGHLSKKRKGGRPESSAWDSFEKITLPEDKQKSTKRNYDGKCLACGEIVKGQPSNLLQHLANCDHVDTTDQMAAMSEVVARGSSGNAQAPAGLGVDATSTSGKDKNKSSPMKKYLDKAAIGPAEMRRLQKLLCLVFVMCGWSFTSVDSPFFLDFCSK